MKAHYEFHGAFGSKADAERRAAIIRRSSGRRVTVQRVRMRGSVRYVVKMAL